MKKYLLKLCFDICDEDNVGLLQIVTEDAMKKLIGTNYHGSFGNIDGSFNDDDNVLKASDFIELTETDVEVLTKLGLDHFECGYVGFDN